MKPIKNWKAFVLINFFLLFSLFNLQGQNIKYIDYRFKSPSERKELVSNAYDFIYNYLLYEGYPNNHAKHLLKEKGVQDFLKDSRGDLVNYPHDLVFGKAIRAGVGDDIRIYPVGNVKVYYPSTNGKKGNQFLTSNFRPVSYQYKRADGVKMDGDDEYFIFSESFGYAITYWEDGTTIANIYEFKGGDEIKLYIMNTSERTTRSFNDNTYMKGEGVMAPLRFYHFGYKDLIQISLSESIESIGQYFLISEWKSFYPGGNLKAQGNYNFSSQKKNGIWKYYNEEGNLILEETFENGLLHGHWSSYYKSGQEKETKTYVNGEVQGSRATFYPDGSLECLGQWVNGNQIGNYSCSYKNGRPMEMGEYLKNGNIRVKRYYPLGTRSEEGFLRINREQNKLIKIGDWKFFYESGQLESEMEYSSNGDLKFIWQHFSENGKQGILDGNGIYSLYYENGNMEFEAEVKGGKRDGRATWYYPNGQIEQSAVYRPDPGLAFTGKRWKILESYTRDGKARETGTLENGNGSWIKYDESEEVIKVDYYVNGIYSEHRVSGYQSIRIGDQVWMVENLKVTHFRNGDQIPVLSSADSWMETYESNACCYLEYDPKNKEYGVLYNGNVINDERNIAPEGWRLPTKQDFQELLSHLGALKDKTRIKIENSNLEIKSDSEPNSFITPMIGWIDEYGDFIGEGEFVIYHTISEEEGGLIYLGFGEEDFVFDVSWNLEEGFPIRCIKE